MKLTQINEVFEKPSLDGVEIKGDHGSHIYNFHDKGKKYSVRIYGNSTEYMHIEDSHRKIFAGFKEKYGEKMGRNPVEMGAIYLSVERFDGDQNGSFSETGLGNQWFVYGKLIACVQHYVEKNKPILLAFSGASTSMDLVYDKFIKMSQRLYPQDAYVPYTDDTYVRKEIAAVLPNSDMVNNERMNREAKLKDAKDYKNRQRELSDAVSSRSNQNSDQSRPPLAELPEWGDLQFPGN